MTPLLAPRLPSDRERSFERLYRRHVRDVYGFSLGVLGNPTDAEDVTQTTFLNAYRALARGERVDNPRSWLLRIAQNVCRQRFRAAARRPQEVELDAELQAAASDEAAPTAEEIRAALMHLAFNQRTVLVLREIEGRPYTEIAETMGLSVSAVETLLFRARRALREQLEAGDRPLTCDAAELYVSRSLDGRLSRHERGQLRAHLRACPACATFARSHRAQSKALKHLGVVPLPAGIAGALGWSLGGAGVAKAAAVVLSVAAIGTGVAVGSGAVPPPWSAWPGSSQRAERGAGVTLPAAAEGAAKASARIADTPAASVPGPAAPAGGLGLPPGFDPTPGVPSQPTASPPGAPDSAGDAAGPGHGPHAGTAAAGEGGKEKAAARARPAPGREKAGGNAVGKGVAKGKSAGRGSGGKEKALAGGKGQAGSRDQGTAAAASGGRQADPGRVSGESDGETGAAAAPTAGVAADAAEAPADAGGEADGVAPEAQGSTADGPAPPLAQAIAPSGQEKAAAAPN